MKNLWAELVTRDPLFIYRVVNFIISNAPGTTYLSDNDGNSVLHIAADRGHEVLVECLMDTHNFGLIVGARYVDKF